MVTATKVKRPATDAQKAALAKGRAAIAANREKMPLHPLTGKPYNPDTNPAPYVGMSVEERDRLTAEREASAEHGGFWLYLCDGTRRKWPLWVPVETDPEKRTLMLERTEYETGWHGEVRPQPSWPEAYWVADVHDDAELRPAEAGGHVYDASHYVTERTR